MIYVAGQQQILIIFFSQKSSFLNELLLSFYECVDVRNNVLPNIYGLDKIIIERPTNQRQSLLHTACYLVKLHDMVLLYHEVVTTNYCFKVHPYFYRF